MRRALLLAVVVLALGASEAGAHTTIIAPESSLVPYQAWVDASRVPTPDVTLTILADPNGSACRHDAVEHGACTDPATEKIWMNALAANSREIFLHEIGHNADFAMLDDTERAAFMAIYGFVGAWQTGTSTASPHEAFAQVWAECAVKPYLTRRSMHTLGRGPVFGGQPFAGRVRHNRACRLLAARPRGRAWR